MFGTEEGIHYCVALVRLGESTPLSDGMDLIFSAGLFGGDLYFACEGESEGDTEGALEGARDVFGSLEV